MKQWICTIFVLIAMIPLGAFAADDTSGFLTGVARDSNGTALPGVTVIAENQEKGMTRSTVTDADGSYKFPALPLGSYKVTASMTGFQTVKQKITVSLGGKTVMNFDLPAGAVEEVMTVTVTQPLIDVTSTTSGLVVKTDELIERIPVARDQTSVALLAPGSTEGDTAFNATNTENRQLASLGGASVAENSYIVNGLNTTNFRNGLGGSQVPFEFVDEIQVKTGGYQAEFGRSTGGVINVVTKSGGNDWHYSLNFFYEPDSLAETEPDTPFATNSREEWDVMDANLSVSGPIVKDRAFFYLLYNPRDRQSIASDTARDSNFNSDDAFWGGKLDWFITPEHSLELTAFSDQNDAIEEIYDFTANESVGSTVHERGGDNIIVKYSGQFSPNFILSAQYGINQFNRTSQSTLDQNPAIYDSRDGGLTPVGNWANLLPEAAEDEREAYRIDFDWFIGNHSIRAGLDYETNNSKQDAYYSGGIYYRYFIAEEGDFDGVAAGTTVVRDRRYSNGGEFDTKTDSIYIQDSWEINQNFTLNLGLRNTTFDNMNANGDSFIKVNDQIAPRLGFIWDPKGDGNAKVYASYGRYYLPIASNTNIRMSGAETYTEDWYVVESINADWTPTITGGAIDSAVFADGDIPDPGSIRDTSIKPMFQNEFVIGYDMKMSDLWSVGVRGVYRDLGETIEDVAIDAALNEWVAQNMPGVDFEAHGFDYYVLTNPGTDMQVFIDIDGDGTPEEINLTAEELNYPEAERNYYGVDLTFKRQWADNWMIQGSYTWSQSYGNYEGYVRSDNGQDDAGITTLFDQPGLLDGAYGNLPNDRRHNLKVFGAYGWDNGFSVGGNLRFQSGRPINAFGIHPTDEFAADYGAESFYQDGVLVPRGSMGNTDDITRIDLTAQYNMPLAGGNLTFRVDVFNALNGDGVTEVNETAEQESGSADPNYLVPTHYQTPRRVRFSVNFKF
jgi:outer membrane receptor protein involved in Fe transport